MSKVTVTGIEPLVKDLNNLGSNELWDNLKLKALTQMLNRSRKSHNPADGGTPYKTGELRKSSGISGDTFGYTKDYAPHVEYGHRTTSGGYTPGRYFVKRNAEIQQGIIAKDTIKEIKKVIKGHAKDD